MEQITGPPTGLRYTWLCVKGHTSTAKILIDRRVSCEMTVQVSAVWGPRAKELRPSTFNVVHEIAIHKNVEVLDYFD